MQHILYPFNRATLSGLILFLLSALNFQSQAQSGSVTTTQSFSYTGQIVPWTVPTGVTSLTIEARGAEGGGPLFSYVPGKGAIIRGTLTVIPGQALSILVGQQPTQSTRGGGGGSFVVTGSNPILPLIIAGGGGGGGGVNGGTNSGNYDANSKQGQTANNAGKGTGPNNAGGAGGTTGSGGNAGSGQVNAAGGGGLTGNGLNGGYSGGTSFVNGGAGGAGSGANSDQGGFGGGGSGNTVIDGGYTVYAAGGGGGGYTGGGGGSYAGGGAGVGGGGGSYNAGTSLTAVAGANAGNGLVTISYAVPAQPIRYVKQGGTGDGTSWANASGDLQSQIDIAGAEQVWVAGGRYTRANGGPFSLKNGMAVYGGFVGNESSLGARPGVNPVGGQPSSTTLTVSSGSVLRNTNLDNTARLDGVVITGGNYGLQGGGIFNVSSSPSLTNCVISGNSATGDGGGISNNNSSPSLTNCVISGNSTNYQGGGIFNVSSSPSLTNCLISGNSTSLGGGFYNVISSPRLINCTLTANRAVAGAALINYSDSQPVLTNTILWDNQESANTAINNNDGTGVTANYCLIGKGETDFTGSNNLTATSSPFVSSTNFMLRAGSQAIDAGDPASTTATSGATDLGGNPRVANNRIDQGAYEFQGPFCQPVAITRQPISGSSVCVGSTVTAMVSVTGTSPAYQWYKGSVLVSGQTSPTLTLTNVQTSQTGSYSVVVTGSCPGSVTSTAFSLTVNALPSVSITPTTQTICQGQSATLTAKEASTYQWSTGQTSTGISVTATGSYSVTGTTSGCSATATASLTVNPVPQPPLIATQSGHSYPGGVSSLIISQNVGNVILMVSGCMGGTITWAGGNSNTLAVSTMNAGRQTFTATCTQNGCASLLATATVTVVPTTLSVLHRDGNGQVNTNTLAPYLELQNDGNTAIPYAEITVRYWLTVENYAPLLFSINYAQLGSDKVHLKYVPAATGNPTATGYIEFSFDVSAGNLGAMSNSGPIQDLINKQDYSYFDQSNDYSYVNTGNYTPNTRITAYRNGVLFYGLEPGPVVPMQSVKAMLQNNTGDGANSIEAVLSVTNDGNVPINYGDIKVRYYFTADNNQPLVLSQAGYTALGSANVSAQIVTISPALAGADRYLELSFSSSLGQLAPGASTGGVTYQIRHADYSGFTQTNDYSYQGTGGTMVNPHVVVFVAGTRAYGTEPGTGARLSTEEAETPLRVQVLGNPVRGSAMEVVVSGAEGQALTLYLTDLTGRSVITRQVERAGATESQRLEVGSVSGGLLLLRVSTSTQSQTVKILRQ